jgi:hypothetical protein
MTINENEERENDLTVEEWLAIRKKAGLKIDPETAESGATESELNAMFGRSGDQMAQLYTKKVDRRQVSCARAGEVDAALVRRRRRGGDTRASASGKRAGLIFIGGN